MLGEGSCVAERFDDVLAVSCEPCWTEMAATMTPGVRPSDVPLSAPDPSHSPQLVDCTLVSSACSLGDFMAPTSSGGFCGSGGR